MKCPACKEKIQKSSGVCPGCGLRLPPKPTFVQRLMYMPILETLFGLIITIGIVVLVYRFALPNNNQEPIINMHERVEINSNVGVVFFNNANEAFKKEIDSGIKKLDIIGNCDIKYKYNADESCYSDVVNSLVSDGKCKDIIITDSKHYDLLVDIAKTHTDTDFFVLWGDRIYNDTPPENVHICRIDNTSAIRAIGINTANKLTEMIKSIDVTDPEQAGITHTVLFLYKTDYGYSMYNHFLSGVKQINPNLNTSAVKVENESEYVQQLASQTEVYALMVADEMPQITESLSEINSDSIYLSGVSKDVTAYPNYLCSITIDHATYINFIFKAIEGKNNLWDIYNGTYEDSFCRLDYNKSIIGTID